MNDILGKFRRRGAYALAPVRGFAFTGLAMLAALAVLAAACANQSGPEEPAQASAAGTAANAEPVDLAATVTSILDRVPQSTPMPEQSVSDIVADLVDGLVQIVTPDTRGSGFVISSDGLIVTNAHLLGDHDPVTVRSVNGWPFAGTVLGKDDDLDLAVIEVASRGGIRPMPLGDVSAVRHGDPVIAMGFPLSSRLGEGYTITTGIVSSLRTGGPTDLIQTDAAINAGSSGGPLVNSDGEVIGVTTSTYRDYSSVSFAISIGEVKDNLRALTAGRDALSSAGGEFENYRNRGCRYSLRAPSEWEMAGEGEGCRLYLRRYDGNNHVGTVYIRDYPLNEAESLDEFSDWWSNALMERASEWSSFTQIHSETLAVERDGDRWEEHAIDYSWQESEDHCVSYATDRVVVSDEQSVALVFHASLCGAMPPSLLAEVADIQFHVSPPTPASEQSPGP